MPNLKLSVRFKSMKTEKVLVLRTCNSELKSYGGFQWKEKGIVEAPDFKATKECGNGLHGFLWGEGYGNLASWNDTDKWLVCEVNKKDIIDLGDKVKFLKCKVVFCGNRKEATDYIISNGAQGKAVIGAYVITGDNGTSKSGHYGTSTSGYYGTSTSGYNGTSKSGHYGTSTSGYYGTSTSGYKGTSTSGYNGTSTSGYNGTSTSGYKGTSTSGYNGTSTSGHYGTLIIKYWDGVRYKVAVGYVGENGIKANVPYKLNEKHEFVEVK